MSESTRLIPQIDEADTEVELSAQELLALSNSLPSDERTTDSTSESLQPTTSAPSRKLDAPKPSADRTSRLAASIIAIVSLAGVAHVLMPSERASQSTAETSRSLFPSKWPLSEKIAKEQPVRFANPFDAEEVFEFPPGTTETEARDAVAAVLMERAASRQET